MSDKIRVTCPGCHTRFNVSDKFAGRQGPCPKCKRPIQIPSASEEVTVHAPTDFGPKGLSGDAVLKPVFRDETNLSPVQIVLIGATIFGLLALAGLVRIGVSDKPQFSSIVLLLLSVGVAVPCVLAGYTFLRDQELGALLGQELWIRVGCCSVIYGLLWSSFYLANLAMIDDYGTTTLLLGVTAMFVLGSVTANLFLGLDLLMGILHFGLYFGCCLALRAVAGFSILPSALEPPVEDPTVAGLGAMWQAMECLVGLI